MRHPLSSRQQKARSKTKRTGHERLTKKTVATQHLVGSAQRWVEVNAALGEHVGDAQLLPEDETREA